MVKTRISRDKANQILLDSRDRLEERLAASVGPHNYNAGPLNDALNAIDIQLGRSGPVTHSINRGEYDLAALLDNSLRSPVERVLRHVRGLSLFPSPDSLNYSKPELVLGMDDVGTKWAAGLSKVNPKIKQALETNIVAHDLIGFSGRGFEELSPEIRQYLTEFHNQLFPLMQQRVALEKNRKEYAKLGAGALGGAALGVGAGYVIDTSQIYNFYTQLLLARFPVAMMESVGIAIAPISEWVKQSLGQQELEPVVKDNSSDTDSFAIWNLSAPGLASLLSAGGEVSGMNRYPLFDGFVNVQMNNSNNQLGLIGMYRDYISRYGPVEGRKKFIRDPFVLSNLVVTAAYLASAILIRSTGTVKFDSGVKSGSEAGLISCDTALATALAMGFIYSHYITKHNQMLRSGLREKVYADVTQR